MIKIIPDTTTFGYGDTSLGAWQNKMNIMHGFAANSLFCKVHACVCLDTYFNLSPRFQLDVLYIKISYQARFCLQIIISCSFIYNPNGIFKSWVFYRSHPFAQAGDILVLQRANTAQVHSQHNM